MVDEAAGDQGLSGDRARVWFRSSGFCRYALCLTRSINLTNMTKQAMVRHVTQGIALPEVGFSAAKSELSSLMDEVVHERHPTLVSRHRGRETMLLVRPDDLARWLDSFRLTLHVTLGDGDVAVEAVDLGVTGLGETFELAVEDLAEELRAYAGRFFEQATLYMHSDRARHYPQLLRFALRPREEQLELLVSDIEAAYEAEREAVASPM
jgi:hypothetical protein